MFRKITAAVLSFSLVMMAPQLHAASTKPGEKTAQSSTQGARKHLGNIIFAGLAGAILGLSTLSFYGRPQDRLSNIAVGFAFGIISGTLYTTYKAAAEPKEFYGLRRDVKSEAWRLSESAAHPAPTLRSGYTFTF
jgi:hypothetical protein